MIPDPVVSWAMYEELNQNVLYYTFDAKKGDRLYSSIVIPKLDGLENFNRSWLDYKEGFGSPEKGNNTIYICTNIAPTNQFYVVRSIFSKYVHSFL